MVIPGRGNGGVATLNLNVEIDLTDEELSGLADALGCKPDEVEANLPPFAKAALREQADMILGVAPITTASDLRERRLVTLIENAFGGRIPNVNRVARMFSIAPSTARALLRAVAAKHRHRLGQALRAEIADFLRSCAQPAGQDDWEVTVLNPILIEILNDRLENAAQSKAPIRKSPDALGLYVIPNGSYEWIRNNQ